MHVNCEGHYVRVNKDFVLVFVASDNHSLLRRIILA